MRGHLTTGGPASTYVQVRGVDLLVCREGAGRPFLWAHGLTSSIAEDRRRGLYDWSSLTEGHEVVSYDARGHGASGFSLDPVDYTWETLARDILSLRDALGLDDFDLGGVSMGAASALWAALLEPSGIRSLVLAGLPAAWEFRNDLAQRYQASAHIAEKYGLAELSRRARLVPPAAIYADAPERAHTDLTVNETAAPHILRGAAMSDLPEIRALAGIDQPTLILSWQADPAHPVIVAETVSAALSNAELGVAANVTQILAWPDRVRSFLDSGHGGHQATQSARESVRTDYRRDL